MDCLKLNGLLEIVVREIVVKSPCKNQGGLEAVQDRCPTLLDSNFPGDPYGNKNSTPQIQDYD